MKQILIVEDDSFLNKMLAYNLTADGYGDKGTPIVYIQGYFDNYTND